MTEPKSPSAEQPFVVEGRVLAAMDRDPNWRPSQAAVRALYSVIEFERTRAKAAFAAGQRSGLERVQKLEAHVDRAITALRQARGWLLEITPDEGWEQIRKAELAKIEAHLDVIWPKESR